MDSNAGGYSQILGGGFERSIDQYNAPQQFMQQQYNTTAPMYAGTTPMYTPVGTMMQQHQQQQHVLRTIPPNQETAQQPVAPSQAASGGAQPGRSPGPHVATHHTRVSDANAAELLTKYQLEAQEVRLWRSAIYLYVLGCWGCCICLLHTAS